MTILEFIRKNSLLVLIVIVALFVGLVMMDYSGKGSAFSRDYYFKVNGTAYSFQESESLGASGLNYIHSFYTSAQRKLHDKFDANNNDILEESEQQARAEWLETHPAFQAFLNRVDSMTQVLSGHGIAKRAEDNVAINRAILHAEAERLGLKPSKEQLDAYIRNIPLFINDDGSFDQALYQRLVGFRDGVTNNAAEQAFRSVVEDMMIWEALQAMLTSDMAYYSKASDRITDMQSQKVAGRTAWLPASAVSKPADPTEEEIKAYWEAHKSAYKTPERRIVTLYTLTAGEGSNPNELSATANVLLQEISGTNGRGLEELLKKTAEDPQVAPFTYTAATSTLCTQAEPDEILKAEVEYAEDKAALSVVAFKEVQEAPALADYEKAKAAGNLEQIINLRQIPGFYFTTDNKIVFVRVEAIEAPRELTYEEAKDQALKALAVERENNALQIAAEKMYADMTEAMAAGADTAFKKAEEAGATVEDFGPVSVGIGLGEDLPKGMDATALMCSPSGKLMELVVLPEDGARATVVERRTVMNDRQQQATKLYLSAMYDAALKRDVMVDWLISAYSRLEVVPSKHITGSNEE